MKKTTATLAATVALSAAAIALPTTASAADAGCVSAKERRALDQRMTLAEAADVTGAPGQAVSWAETWQERAHYCARNDTVTIAVYRLGTHGRAWRLMGVDKLRHGAAVLEMYEASQ